MTVIVRLVSGSDVVRGLVRDFARGLGCVVTAATAPDTSIRIEIDDDHSLVELLTHVALSAAKAGVDVTEPVCHVTYQHEGVTSEVTLALRIAEFGIGTAAHIGA